jgi:predicted kinase
MRRVVIFDIDGTLANCSHRIHHVKGPGPKDWDAFFAKMGDDVPVPDVVDVYHALGDAGYSRVICTGRPEKYRRLTETWLRDAWVCDYEALYMRPNDDTRPDHVVKREILSLIRKDGYEPWLVIDDRQSVVDMWRDEGLTCLQCAPSVEGPEKPALLTIMVGPSGAGKSKWLTKPIAHSFGVHPSHVVASDQLRADLCGDFLDQSKNNEVFEALHAIVKTRLQHGLATVVDATNIRRKDRLAIVDLQVPGGPVRYVVLNRPMEEKRRDGGWRNTLPIDLLAKHEQTFQSQLKDILAGDSRPNVEVVDLRRDMVKEQAA